MLMLHKPYDSPQVRTRNLPKVSDLPRRAVHACMAWHRRVKERRCTVWGTSSYLCIGHRHNHLGSVLGDTARLIFLPDHEAIDVLQKDERNSSLGAQLNEVRPCSNTSVTFIHTHVALQEDANVIGKVSARAALAISVEAR